MLYKHTHQIFYMESTKEVFNSFILIFILVCTRILVIL